MSNIFKSLFSRRLYGLSGKKGLWESRWALVFSNRRRR